MDTLLQIVIYIVSIYASTVFGSWQSPTHFTQTEQQYCRNRVNIKSCYHKTVSR